MDFNTDPEEDYNVWSWKDTKIPIIISMSDQSASIFGSQCFQLNSAKITLGTGGFLNVNTGKSCLSSRKGLYPLIGWQFNDDTIYCLEGSANDMASILNWGQQCGFYNQPQDSNAIASSVLDTDGVYFISAFSGLGVRIYILYYQHILALLKYSVGSSLDIARRYSILSLPSLSSNPNLLSFFSYFYLYFIY